MRRRLLLALAALLAAAPLPAQLVFEGYMTAAEQPKIIVSDGQGKKSGWLALGETFEGFTLVALRAEDESLLVEKAGQRHVLKLRGGTVVAPKPESPATARLRSLTGLPLAYELAKRDDDKEITTVLKPLLQRYDEALRYEAKYPPSGGDRQKSDEALKFIKAQAEKIAAQIAARLLAESGKP